MTQIMLHRDRTESFRRCVRRALKKDQTGRGEVLRTLVFEPGKPVELNATDFKAIEDDLKKGIIVEVMKDERGRIRPVKKAKPETIDITLEDYERDIAEAEARGRQNLVATSNGDGNGEHAPG